MTNGDIQTLKQIWEHFDGIADGAPDASYPAKMALQFCEPLAAIIARAEQETPEAIVQARLAKANSGTAADWDKEVTALRNEGLLR